MNNLTLSDVCFVHLLVVGSRVVAALLFFFFLLLLVGGFEGAEVCVEGVLHEGRVLNASQHHGLTHLR